MWYVQREMEKVRSERESVYVRSSAGVSADVASEMSGSETGEGDAPVAPVSVQSMVRRAWPQTQ